MPRPVSGGKRLSRGRRAGNIDDDHDDDDDDDDDVAWWCYPRQHHHPSSRREEEGPDHDAPTPPIRVPRHHRPSRGSPDVMSPATRSSTVTSTVSSSHLDTTKTVASRHSSSWGSTTTTVVVGLVSFSLVVRFPVTTTRARSPDGNDDDTTSSPSAGRDRPTPPSHHHHGTGRPLDHPMAATDTPAGRRRRRGESTIPASDPVGDDVPPRSPGAPPTPPPTTTTIATSGAKRPRPPLLDVSCSAVRWTPRPLGRRPRHYPPLSRRRMIRATMATTLKCLLLLLITILPTTRADWIDPDTPPAARTTRPYAVIPYHPPRDDPARATHHHGSPTHRNGTTTAAPTVSPRPTASPTTTPTAAPTSHPTSTPRDHDGDYVLVFSDEFNVPDRTFHDGHDPRWTALDKNDYTNDALHYYSPRQARTVTTTAGPNTTGHLVIQTVAADTPVLGFDDVQRQRTHVTKHFSSAMLQSWNKFCFTGGILEAQVVLPGNAHVGGLWPALWLLGNLARHTYVGTSEHIWPWSSTVCTVKSDTAQLVSACHAAAHYGFAPGLGRGAPEMDVFEVQPGNLRANQGVFLKTPVGQPFMSASYQVAPGRSANRPGPGEWPGPGQWYSGLEGGKNTSVNILFYGNYNAFRNDVHPALQDYWSDAISYNRQLNASYFTEPHVYRLEWGVPDVPPLSQEIMTTTNASKNRTTASPSLPNDGYLRWFVDGELVLAINGTALREAGYGASISSEPSYLILNTAVSKQWGFPHECPGNCPCKMYDCQSTDYEATCGFSEGFCDMVSPQSHNNNNNTTGRRPPEYKIDWIRVYQNPHDPVHKVGCSTPERPTRRFIDAHAALYKTDSDDVPLKAIAKGRGVCIPPSSANSPRTTTKHAPLLDPPPSAANCGGVTRGTCTAGRVCECHEGWTGPHCLAHDGFDPIIYDAPDTLADVGFIPPSVLPRVLLGGLLVLSTALWLSMRQRHIWAGWTPLPDVVAEYEINRPSAKHHPYQQQRTFRL